MLVELGNAYTSSVSVMNRSTRFAITRTTGTTPTRAVGYNDGGFWICNPTRSGYVKVVNGLIFAYSSENLEHGKIRLFVTMTRLSPHKSQFD